MKACSGVSDQVERLAIPQRIIYDAEDDSVEFLEENPLISVEDAPAGVWQGAEEQSSGSEQNV